MKGTLTEIAEGMIRAIKLMTDEQREELRKGLLESIRNQKPRLSSASDTHIPLWVPKWRN